MCVRIDDIRDRTVVPAVSWSVRHGSSTLAGGGALVLFSLLLVGSEAVRVIVFDAEMNPPENVQVDLRLPAGTPFGTTLAAARQVVDAAHAMNEQLPGESINAVSIVAGDVLSPRPVAEESNGSHLAGVRGPSERTARPAGIAGGNREDVAAEHRRAPVPGTDGGSDHETFAPGRRSPTR